jgi:hypothetical protein
MRVYIPASTSLLHRLVDDGVIGVSPITAFAVTPGLREWYAEGDLEELEYVASTEAARASLRLIANDDSAKPRRVVIAADVADDLIEVRDDLDRGVVRVATRIALTDCVSVHIDDADAEATIAAAAAVVDEADIGDAAAEAIVDDADGYELSWYATQEIGSLLELLDE